MRQQKMISTEFHKVRFDAYFIASRGGDLYQFRRNTQHTARKVLESGAEEYKDYMFNLGANVFVGDPAHVF